MSKLTVEKPFYLRPPWQILFDLVRLQKIRPWDVNVAYLLSSLISEMKQKGYIDFAASGTALLSSCVVLRRQSELIMKLEEPPRIPEPKPRDVIPPPLMLPFRFELTSTTIDSLLQYIEEAMKAVVPPRLAKPAQATPPQELFQEYDRYFVEVEAKIKTLLERLAGLRSLKPIPFTQIVSGADRLEAVRTFLLLLFLAARGLILLFQEEEFGEIYIVMKAGGRSAEPVATV